MTKLFHRCRQSTNLVEAPVATATAWRSNLYYLVSSHEVSDMYWDFLRCLAVEHFYCIFHFYFSKRTKSSWVRLTIKSSIILCHWLCSRFYVRQICEESCKLTHLLLSKETFYPTAPFCYKHLWRKLQNKSLSLYNGIIFILTT